jgi:hypothetical protein
MPAGQLRRDLVDDVRGTAGLAARFCVVGLERCLDGGITGIDDHSRYCVIAKAVLRATAWSVYQAFVDAMKVYGVGARASLLRLASLVADLHVLRVFCGPGGRHGNQLGVVPDGHAVATGQHRQAEAARLGFSETSRCSTTPGVWHGAPAVRTQRRQFVGDGHVSSAA